MKVRRRASELSVRRALRDAKTLVPTDGSLTGLIEAIAREHRRTLIRVEVDLTGSALSGAWIPVDGVDYLLFPKDAPPTRASAVVCHELAHLLLGHDPAIHLGGTLEKVQAALAHLSPVTVERMLSRTGYSDRQERNAEYFATVLHTRLVSNRVAHQWRAASLLSDRLR